jgi:hypothetical protein
MRFKIRAMVIMIVFCGILYLPFAVHAANGNIFSGLSIPSLNSSGSADEGNGSADQYDASMEEYAQSLPKPAKVDSAAAQYIDFEYMRNHMYNLKQDGQSTKQCAACHTNREEFCDRCHNFAGVNPKIDY